MGPLAARDVDTGVEHDPALRAWINDGEAPATYYAGRRRGRWVGAEAWPSAATHERVLPLAALRGGGDGPVVVRSPQHTGADAGRFFPFGNATDLPPDQRAEDGRSVCFDLPVGKAFDLLGNVRRHAVRHERPAPRHPDRAAVRRRAGRLLDARHPRGAQRGEAGRHGPRRPARPGTTASLPVRLVVDRSPVRRRTPPADRGLVVLLALGLAARHRGHPHGRPDDASSVTPAHLDARSTDDGVRLRRARTVRAAGDRARCADRAAAATHGHARRRDGGVDARRRPRLRRRTRVPGRTRVHRGRPRDVPHPVGRPDSARGAFPLGDRAGEAGVDGAARDVVRGHRRRRRLPRREHRPCLGP